MNSTNINLEDIKKIFQDMFKQHQEAKQEEMFRSHENSIMRLISGNTALTNYPADTKTSQRRRRNVLILVSKTS